MTSNGQRELTGAQAAEQGTPIRDTDRLGTMSADRRGTPIRDTGRLGTMSADEQSAPIRDTDRQDTMSVDGQRSGREDSVLVSALACLHSVNDRRDLQLWEAIAEIIEIAGNDAGFHEEG